MANRLGFRGPMLIISENVNEKSPAVWGKGLTAHSYKKKSLGKLQWFIIEQ